MLQVSQALSQNNVTLPAGIIIDEGRAFPIKTTNSFGSLEELGDLVIGASPSLPPPTGQTPSTPPAPVRLRDVAEVQLGLGIPTSISRTNGKPSLGVSVIKEADANTIDVTTDALAALDALALPSGVEIATVSNSGPDIQA